MEFPGHIPETVNTKQPAKNERRTKRTKGSVPDGKLSTNTGAVSKEAAGGWDKRGERLRPGTKTRERFVNDALSRAGLSAAAGAQAQAYIDRLHPVIPTAASEPRQHAPGGIFIENELCSVGSNEDDIKDKEEAAILNTLARRASAMTSRSEQNDSGDLRARSQSYHVEEFHFHSDFHHTTTEEELDQIKRQLHQYFLSNPECPAAKAGSKISHLNIMEARPALIWLI